MHPVLNHNQFLFQEHVGAFKAANNYDVYDPDAQQQVLLCREEKLGPFTRLLRFSKYKTMTPFDLDVRTPEGEQVLEITRGVSLFLSTVKVLDGQGRLLGTFKQKFFSIGGAFDVLDPQERVVCQLKGKWTGWNFRFIAGEIELAHVTKQWSGWGREMLTSADSYALVIHEGVPADSPVRPLILAAVLCIDMVLKE